MAVLGAEVDDDNPFVYSLVIRIETGFKLCLFGCGVGIRLGAFLAPGDFQISRHFQIVAGGNSPSPGKLFLDRGSTSLR